MNHLAAARRRDEIRHRSQQEDVNTLARIYNLSPYYIYKIIRTPAEPPEHRYDPLIALAKQGLTRAEIARKLDLSHSHVSYVLAETHTPVTPGIPGVPKGTRLNEALHKHVVSLFNLGLRYREIADETGVTYQRVQQILKANGLRRRK